MTSERARRLTWLPIAGLIAVAAWWAFAIIDRSSAPDPHAAYHGQVAWTYPTTEVIATCGALALEVALAALALRLVTRTSRTSAATAVIGCAYALLFFASLPLGSMHVPTYLAGHIAASFCAGAWCFVAAAIAFGVELVGKSGRT